VTFAPLLIPSVRRVDDDGQPDGVALEASAAGAGASA
jgi:hypothetical protein